MTTHTLTKQISELTTQEIRFIVHSNDMNDYRAIEVCRWQTSLNTGRMQQQTSHRHFVGNSRNLWRDLLKQGFVAA
jgi:hypothetical protein